MTDVVPRTLPPMLARLVRELPRGAFRYEPKWDGFRCLAFRDDDEVDLRSRHGRPLGRYFPEVAAAVGALPEPHVVLDGEIVLADPAAGFAALMERIHPAASRVDLLAARHPARLIAFDLLAVGGNDLRDRPAADRRSLLERLLVNPPAGLALTPQTADAAIAEQWLDAPTGSAIDGVVARPEELPYRAGARALIKIKRDRTADCVIAGLRTFGDRPAVASLLLGLYDAGGDLRHVGVVSNLREAERRRLLELLTPLAVPLAEHPWRDGYLLGGGATGRLKGAAGRWDPTEMVLDWTPLAPSLVAEVAFNQVDDGRFRHPARLRRLRPDREARSCLLDQLQPGEGDGARAAAAAV